MFKKGSKYSRKQVGEIFYPGVGHPKGGDWATGYVRVEDKLFSFQKCSTPVFVKSAGWGVVVS